MTQDNDKQVEKTEVAVDSEKNPSVKQDDKQNFVPQSRLNEVVAKNKSIIDKLTEENNQFKAKEEEQRKKQLEADGKHTEIIAEQDKTIEKLQSYYDNNEQKRTERRSKLLETIPENQRDVYKELSLEALEEHIKLSQNEDKKVNTDTRQPVRNGKPIRKDWYNLPPDELREVYPTIHAEAKRKHESNTRN